MDAGSKVTREENMEVYTTVSQATPGVSGASVVAPALSNGESAMQTPFTSAGPHPQQGQKTKKRAISQQGFGDRRA